MPPLDLYLDDDFTGAIAGAGPIMTQIDFKTTTFPGADWQLPVPETDIPGATLTWAAQAGKLLILLHLNFGAAMAVPSRCVVRPYLDGALITPVVFFNGETSGGYNTMTAILKADVAAGTRTVKFRALDIGGNRGWFETNMGRMTCVVFPTTMIVP